MNKQINQKDLFEMIHLGKITPEEGLLRYKQLDDNKPANLESESVYFEYKWEKSKSEMNIGNEKLAECILVFDTNENIYNILKKINSKKDGNIILVKPGEQYDNMGDQIYTIRKNLVEDYIRLIKELKEKNSMPDTVIHMWSERSVPNHEEIRRQLDVGLYSVFNLVQSLMKQKLEKSLKLYYYYPAIKGEAQPHNQAISGFLKTVTIENSNFICRTVQIDEHTKKSDVVLQELEINQEKNTEIKYENSDRFVKELALLDSNKLIKSKVKIKENGVYLITGGCGGIGLIFAEYLAKHKGVKLILTGRSELNSKGKRSIQRLKDLGADVRYIKSDVSNKNQVEDLLKNIKSHYEEINGVIHSAGVIRDSFVLKKNIKELEEVLAPKVFGLMNLSEILKNEDLDFFTVFSSLSGVTGNLGQGDYAYANSFMDHYVQVMKEDYRKVISIAWPLWKDGGMEVDFDTKERLLKDFGLIPMSSDRGIKAFEIALQLPKEMTQIMVFEGNKEKILDVQNTLKSRKNNQKTEAAKRETVQRETVQRETVQSEAMKKLDEKDKKEIQKKAEQYFKQMLAKEIEMSETKIQAEETFENYGIDSVIIMNLNKELEKAFDDLPKTLLFEYRNVRELANYFIQNHFSRLLEKLNINNRPLPIKLEVPVTEARKTRFIETPPQTMYSEYQKTNTQDIAIIGVSGRYPMAENLDEFWSNLKVGKDCITEIPSDRWDYKQYFDPDKNKKGTSYSKWGGFIKDVDKFDPLFFNISPKEAELMDPQERLFLETAWHTLEDGGYTRRSLSDKKVGVFVGVMYGYYQFYGAEESLKGNVIALNSSYATIANRVSYLLNLNGPSMAVDTMCSSSLTSIHLACDSIRLGQSEMALAGGVNLTIHPSKYILLSQGKFAASDGKCRSFGEGGDGYVPGEGIGAVLLKSLEQAKEDGDRIYGIIKGSSLNHGGRTNGYSVPNPKAQGDLIAESIKKSGIDPRTISYVEAHGTGTSLGDPIEISGLVKAFGEHTKDKQFCSIGSAKSVIGHLESAAGVAAVTKVLLQMKHKQLVPSIHSEVLNPNIHFKDTPFYVQHELEEWLCPIVNGRSYPRRAGISSFGAGGSNAHIIIEEYQDETSNESIIESISQPHVFILSAKNDEQLIKYAKTMLEYLNKKVLSKSQVVSETDRMISAQGKLVDDLIEMVSSIININRDEIDISESITDYGLDPTNISNLVYKINERYNLNIYLTLMNEYSSIDLLAKHLCTTYEEVISSYYNKDITKDEKMISYVKINMEELAYTLQIGREGMEQRLALVVSNVDELKNKLDRFVKGKKGIENLIRNNTRERKDTLIFEGEIGKEFINKTIEDKDMLKLAQLWANGLEIEWRNLYEGRKLKPISLPEYPFVKERYWIPEPENESSSLNKEYNKETKLHPFIDKNTSDLEEQKYTTLFTGEEFYLKDHIVSGQKILPGVAYIEMARAAGKMAGKSKVKKLRNIVWARPISIEEIHKEIQISLYPKENNVAYEVVGQENGEPLTYGYGLLEYENDDEETEEYIDIDFIEKRCSKKFDYEEIYQLFRTNGLNYGEGLQSVMEINCNEEEALGKLELPQIVAGSFQDYVLHPSIMDGALQSIIGILEKEMKLGKPYLPFSLEEVEILCPLTRKCIIYVKNNNANENSTIKKFDMVLTDEAGKILVKMNGLVLRAVTANGGVKVRKNSSILKYSSQWERSNLNGNMQENDIENLIMFDTDDTICNHLRKTIKQVILIKPGKKYAELDNDIYEIRTNNQEDYTQLLSVLINKNVKPNMIIHNWSKEKYDSKEKSISNQLNKGIYSLFNLTAVIMKQKVKGKIKVLYMYLQDHGEEPSYAAISGFAKTVKLENPQIEIKTMGIRTSTELVEEILLDELREELHHKSIDIWYDKKERYIRSISKITDQELGQYSSPIENGVYIITGGTGGLGFIFAHHLAQQTKAKIILTGRSELNEYKKEKIKALKKLGAEIEYIIGDVSVRADVHNIIQHTKEKFGNINGIIHSAGINHDSLLLRKTKDEMNEVLDPKVYGIIWLDEETKDEPLDFFAVFSSTSSILGNVGQCDYAYANSFMDHYCDRRESLKQQGVRTGKTLSINWPLWKEGGMTMEESSMKWMEEKLGLLPLNTDDGIRVFEQGLNSSQVRLTVLAGDEEKIERMLGLTSDEKTNQELKMIRQEVKTIQQESMTIQQEGTANQIDENKNELLIKKTEEYLKDILSKETKIPSNKIDSKKVFEEYGIDSVMIVSLNRELEEYFGELTKTLLFEYQNISELTSYFIENHKTKLIEKLNLNTQPKSDVSTQFKSEPGIKNQGLLMSKSRFHKIDPLTSSVQVQDDIAIIGLSGRYPMANNVKEFWNNLTEGRDCITEIPLDRWDYKEDFDSNKDLKGKSYSKWGGFINDVDKFDPLFFKISPKEAELMDPQERLFLETAWQTVEDAGYTKTDLSEYKVGVYVGVMYGHYQLYGAEESSSYASIANRVSYCLNLTGTSLAVDTMCSSSLTSVHLACESIHRGENQLAIAGGVNVSIHPNKYIALSQGRFVSSDGKCRSFGEGGDGYVPGEGVGAILLKPLKQAKEDGDHIYAIIKGSSVNHGGKTNGYTVPNPKAQKAVISEAINKSGVDPRSISYIEAHGTGTSLGDPIEITGLVKAFGEYTKDKQFCSIGSAKSNIGHLESAAGIAGITKILLQMKYKQLVPSIHSDTLNSNINFNETPFWVQHKLEEWKCPEIDTKKQPRRAGISSFGAGGSNAHIILEEVDTIEYNTEGLGNEPQLILLSAKNMDSLKVYVKDLIDILKADNPVEESDVINIMEMAYTLQVGREAMDERLALIVPDKEALRQKLMQYLEGKKDIDGLYTGSVFGVANSILTEGRAAEEFIKIIIKDKEFNKLAQLWVSGVEIDWRSLYKGHFLNRISLPTYPFAKEHYWVPESRKTRKKETTILHRLHPLLEANTSNLREQKFTTTFTGEEFYLKDHVISNQKILPGAAYLEMAHAAGEIAGNSKVCKIKNIMWTQPIVVKDQPELVNIYLYPQGDLVEYEVTSIAEDNSRRLHARGDLEFEAWDYRRENSDMVNIEEVKNGCGYVSGDDCYKFFEEKGFAYGDGFRTIIDVFSGETEALVHLKLPNKLINDFNQFTLHPSIIDGALQAVIGITKKTTDDEEALYVPFSIEEIELINTMKDECYVHVVLVEGYAKSGIKKYDISITDMSGAKLVKINNLMLRSLLPITSNRNKTIYFTDHWKMASKDDPNKNKKGSTILVLSNEIANNSMKELEGKLIKVLPGEDFHELDNSTYEIDPQNKDHYRELAVKLKEQGCIPDNIIHMWNKEEFNDGGNIEEQLDKGAYSVLYLLQALMEQKLTKIIKLIYCYESNEQESQPQNAGLSGLFKTISIENPNMKCKCVEVVSPSESDLFHIALEEAQIDDGVEVLYKNNERYVKEFEELDPPSENKKLMNFKNKGVYIITGGTGGLGIITAQFLAKEFHAKLVLSGRSELNDIKEQELQRLRELGAEVVYVKADVSKKNEVEKLISEAKKHYLEINGVIHSAGILRDAFLFKKTKEEMEAVLAPKVYGTLFLDQATKNENLDFFVVYSSAAGKLGNVGQCDYAFGNSFTDYYCKKRDKLKAFGKRSGITLSINWPLWKDGGMKVDKAIEKSMEDQMGLTPMDLESGMKALQDGLKLGVVNMLVLSGDKTRIKSMLEAEKNSHTIENLSNTNLSSRQDELLFKKSEIFFKELLSNEIKLPVAKIISAQPFEIYGIDSVMIMSLNKEFENNFGELPKTLLFEYKSIEELTNYFMNHHKERLIEKIGIAIEKNQIQKKESFMERKELTIQKPRFQHTEIAQKEGVNKDIAIIGLSGRYPMAKNLEEFWDNMKNGKDCITEIPFDRWDHSQYFDPDKNKKGKCYTKWGGFLEDVDMFDPLFFNISPKEAELMDPQERLFLETAWNAVEDAGYTKEVLSQSCVGVFVGVMNGHYQMYGVEESIKGNIMALNSSFASIANRVSYCLNLSGPSIAIDTMCSSSITAIHLACESIRSGDSDIVIAGGVNLSIHPNKYIGLSQGRFVSTDGKCRSFGEGGDGYVPGEGVGAVILKPLHKAIEDKDLIYGVIKGSSINHGGKTNGYTIPNPNAQGTLIDKAIKRAGIEPRSISYIEAHGTGTSLGDPVEISGLMKAFGNSKDKQYCSIGSVKSNVGHLESAAGIAGLTKVLLQMKYKELVPSIHSQVLNPNINFSTSPFFVQSKFEEWKQPDIEGRKIPRRAGISAFGAGGANAHMIIEEYVQNAYPDRKEEQKPYILILSASNTNRLREYAFRLIKSLSNLLEHKTITPSLESISYTLQVGREALDERLAVIAYTIPEAIKQVTEYLRGKSNQENIYIGNKKHIQQTIEKLLNVQKGKEFIKDLMQNNELEMLAELWVSGVDLNWKHMYRDKLPQKISLPTYPFAKERYWVPGTIEKSYPSITRQTSQLNVDKEIDKLLEVSRIVESESFKSETFKGEVTTQFGSIDKTGNILIESTESHNHSSIEEVIEERTRFYLMELMSKEIKLPIERIEVDVPIEKYGVDSVMIMQFTNELEKSFGQLPKTLLFEYRTITELTQYFLELYRDQLSELFGIDEFIYSIENNIEESTNIEKEIIGNKESIGKELIKIDKEPIKVNKEPIKINKESNKINKEPVNNLKEPINHIKEPINHKEDYYLSNDFMKIKPEDAAQLLTNVDMISEEDVERLLKDADLALFKTSRIVTEDSSMKEESEKLEAEVAVKLLLDVEHLTDEEVTNLLDQIKEGI
ncbi:MAG: hypothetical protein CVU84_01405 [Firmicutes bacterium HGW-Firmicutes-1]|jgi:polyketide synthase PksN|nr:MAG: hypothetical protein CVU84_01405 [Firmicutes bacterium HGW-Firmicutes-1]